MDQAENQKEKLAKFANEEVLANIFLDAVVSPASASAGWLVMYGSRTNSLL